MNVQACAPDATSTPSGNSASTTTGQSAGGQGGSAGGAGGASGAGGAGGAGGEAPAPGSHVWSLAFSGSEFVYQPEVAVDAAGNVAVVGFFYGTVKIGNK